MRALLALVAMCSTASADPPLRVYLSWQGEDVGRSLRMLPLDFQRYLETRIAEAFGVDDPDAFLRTLSEATGFSHRGQGVDYTLPDGVIAGVSVQTVLAGDGAIHDDSHPTGGQRASFNVMLGLNLSRWGHPKLTFFVDSMFERATLGQLDGIVTQLGAHGQYRVVAPSGRWLGLSLTSGLEYSRWKFNTGGGTVRLRFDFDDADPPNRLLIDCLGRYALQANVFTIPVEASTGARLGRFATVFGGAAIDLNVRSTAGMSVNLDGLMRTWDDAEAGSFEIALTDEATGHPASGRLFAGAQLKLWKVALFAQSNLSSSPALSVVGGIRIAE